MGINNFLNVMLWKGFHQMLLISTASTVNKPRLSDLLNEGILKHIPKWLQELNEHV